jgi:DNA end-binding protein Ku
MPARSIGTATISFGLVSIPTKLYTTNESGSDIHFNMLHDADGARLKQQYVCTQCNEVVDRDHTVKGYEHAKGQYVVLTSEEIKALDAVASQTIALEEFVPAAVSRRADHSPASLRSGDQAVDRGADARFPRA